MWSVEKCAEQYRIGDNSQKESIYEGVIIVPTVLYGSDAWGVRSAKRSKENVLEMMFDKFGCSEIEL